MKKMYIIVGLLVTFGYNNQIIRGMEKESFPFEINSDTQKPKVINNFHAFFVQQPQQKNPTFFERRIAGFDQTLDAIIAQVFNYMCISTFMWAINKLTGTQTPEALKAQAIKHELERLRLQNQREKLNQAERIIELMQKCNDSALIEKLKHEFATYPAPTTPTH